MMQPQNVSLRPQHGSLGEHGPHLSAEPLMSRRQVSICTSRPRFMLHISIYSCRCRFMSLLAVASSSWKESTRDKGGEGDLWTSGYQQQKTPSSTQANPGTIQAIPGHCNCKSLPCGYHPPLFSAH